MTIKEIREWREASYSEGTSPYLESIIDTLLAEVERLRFQLQAADHDYETVDAQPIAAAPDLLEALKLLQNCMIARSAVEGDLPWTTDVVAAMKTASTAISKALAE